MNRPAAAAPDFAFPIMEKACRPNGHRFRAAEFLAWPKPAGYVT